MNSIVLSLVLLNFVAVQSTIEQLPYKIPLDHDNLVRMNWYGSNSQDRIVFELSVLTNYTAIIVGFGFSDYGHFENADFFVVELKNQTMVAHHDCHTNENGILVKDDLENYRLISYQATSRNAHLNEIVVRFERDLNTCDDADYTIDSGTTHVLHFILDKTYRKLENILSRNKFNPTKADSKDMKRVQLLRANTSNQAGKTADGHFDIRNHQVKIPSDDTTYWCLVYKLDDKFARKHHITAFEGIIDKANEGIVHHMELFHCVDDPSEHMKTFSGVCTSEQKPDGLRQCRKVVAAWAMGAGPFVYPKHVGGIVGGENYSMYLVLEIHYDNQKLRNDIVDSSGIRIYHTAPNSLRQYDAGIMEIGLEYNAKNSIPPNMSKFQLTGYCLGQCTNIGLPNPDGITVFASQLHTHLTGRKVWTRILRTNQTVQTLNSDLHYSPMFQEIRILAEPVRIMPGDIVLHTCEYNTIERSRMTLGGYAITDEMCVNYLHYYPISKIEACKSSIKDEVLQEFFETLKNLDFAGTSVDASIGDNFNAIRWTPLTSRILDRLYNTASISFSCNGSNGENIIPIKRRSHLKAIDLEQIDLNTTTDCVNRK
jgi:dopamine beta-monooxygenase